LITLHHTTNPSNMSTNEVSLNVVPPTAATEDALESQSTPSKPLKLPVPESLLTKWNAAMGVFHTVLMIVTLSVGNLELRVPIYNSGVALRVGGNDTSSWALTPDTSAVAGWFYLTQLTAIFFALSAGFHLGNVLVWRKYYLLGLEQGYAPFRWAEYSVSASVMILILSYTAGTILNPVLVALFALTMITMFFGHLHEVICRPKSLEEWASPSKLWRLQAHFLGYVPQCFCWGLILMQFIEAGAASTTSASGEKSQMPSFVYAIVIVELLLFWSFGVVQLVVSLRPPAGYYQGELAYMWLSLIAKGVLGMIVLSNVLILGSFTEIYDSA